MKYITLKNTDLNVSAVSLGTDVYGSVLSREISYELLNTYTELGGNVLDTALIYSNWIPGEKSRSEKLIGDWMKEKNNRHDIIISTKGGHPEIGQMHISRLSRHEIMGDIEKSLKHLKTDYVDIYWLHRDDEKLPVGGIMETLGEIVKSGKARYIGMSNWAYYRIDEANKYAKEHNLPLIFGSQIQYSPAIPNPEGNDPTLVLMNDNEYDYFKKTGLTVFAYAAQAKGFFSKMDRGGVDNLNETVRQRYLNPESLKRYEIIKEISEKTGHSIGEIVVAALTNNPNFTTIPIVGCKNTAHLRESLAGADIELDTEILKPIHM